MINLRIPPKNSEELYEFFMHIANPPIKSHVAYVGGIQYIREDWVINTILDKYNRYGLWFHFKESDPVRWHEVYEKLKKKTISSGYVCINQEQLKNCIHS